MDKILTLASCNKYKIYPFQILLLKHVYIIIEIKQISIKTDKQMSKRKYSIHKNFFHVPTTYQGSTNHNHPSKGQHRSSFKINVPPSVL